MSSRYTNLMAHVVLATRHRQDLIDPRTAAELYPFIAGVIRGDKGRLLKIGGTMNHIHMLVRITPGQSMAEMVHRVKSKSAKWINDMLRPPVRFAWQRSYVAFSVSQSRAQRVAAYIADQTSRHGDFSFEEELVLLLEKHGISCEAGELGYP